MIIDKSGNPEGSDYYAGKDIGTALMKHLIGEAKANFIGIIDVPCRCKKYSSKPSNLLTRIFGN